MWTWPYRLMAAGLGVGFLAAVLFYEQSIGVNAVFFVVLVVAVSAILALSERIRPSTGWWILVPAALALVTPFAIRDNAFLGTLNAFVLLLLFPLMAIVFRSGLKTLSLAVFPWSWVTTILATITNPVLVSADAYQARSTTKLGPLIGVIRGLAIALPLLCIFIALFRSADLVFDGLVTDVLGDLNADLIFGYVFITAIIGWIFVGGTELAVRRKLFTNDASLPDVPAAKHAFWQRLPFLEGAIVLVLLDLLFLAFVTVQLRYYFLGTEDLDRMNINHANYAREGFFQLLVAAILTLGVVTAIDLLLKRSGKKQEIGYIVSSLILVASAGVMLASSFRRLSLYELEFGFTQDRVFSHAFTVWIGIVFVVFAIALVTGRRNIIAPSAIVLVVAFPIVMSIFNPDAFIAQQNMARWKAGQRLDVSHLLRLSDDAMPELMIALDTLEGQQKDQLEQGLSQRLWRYDNQTYTWQNWSLSRIEAYTLLNARRDQLPPPNRR